MKRNKISEMTSEEAMDELTFMEVKKLLQKAKKAYEKAQEAEAAVFSALENMCLDLGVPTDAENASDLGEAVACYLNYGEYTLSGLMKEIKEQYRKQSLSGV